MIHIVTAMHAEAAPIIERFGLRRDLSAGPRDIFRGESMDLVVSGIGKIRSAVAVTLLLRPPLETDAHLLVNIGVCAAHPGLSVGALLWINKITDEGSSRRYYPDAIVRHGLPEASITTCDRPAGRERSAGAGELYDMESAGFFEAAGAFVSPHQIACMKVVSDNLDPLACSPALAGKLIGERLPEIERVLFDHKAWLDASRSGVSPEVLLRLSEICAAFRFTSAQRRILGSRFETFLMRGGDPAVLDGFPRVEMTSRRESKAVFERIRDVLAAP